MKKLLKNLRRLTKAQTIGIFPKYAYNFEDAAYRTKHFLMKNIKHNRENNMINSKPLSLLQWMIHTG